MIRALILAHDFPPLNSIGSRRPYSWYKYFYEFGIYPVVITKDWGNDSSSVRAMLSHTNNGETRIEQTSFGQVRKVPMRLSLGEKFILYFGANRLVFIRKITVFINLLLAHLFSGADKNNEIFKEAKLILEKEKFDVIIATGEPFILFKHAYKLSIKFNIPWVADYRDGWYLNHFNQRDKRPLMRILRWWELRFERLYIKRCGFITSVDPLLAEKLSEMHNKPAHIVYNGFDGFFGKNRTPSPAPPLILSHAGTIYPLQQVEVLLQAIEELDTDGKISPQDLEIHFIGLDFFPEQKRRVMNYSPFARKYIFTTERIPQAQVLEFNSTADYLLVFTEENYPVIPAKTYEYISLRRPILAILNNRSILASLLKDLNAGVSIDSTEDLKQLLLVKVAAKKNGATVIENKLDDEKAEFYLRRNQTKIFANLIKQTVEH